ncbi:uncharacterized protein LOC100891154 [Strongylocentrotus purpuratus]|uniref:Death domain-containing protein n=1 Tax=Strongylocentrotus purpuratus TaxID=7668 RepID=A0A7M7GF63_STRPU|nr:uncharacterized protein LOC100891154 [Strongylocentrotus purpuratus]
MRDAGMTNPGTSACFQGIGALCQMFDNHIAQLGKLKETALRTEHELRSKITSMEQEKREYDEKIRRLEQEVCVLKGNGVVLEGGLSQPQRTVPDEGEDWKRKYEEMRKECNTLQELHSKRNLCSNCKTGPGSELPVSSEKISTEEDLPVTMEHKLYLSDKVSGNNIKHVLRHLSVPDTDVENIYYAHHDPKECCIQGLKKWMENKGQKATVGALIKGLLKCNLRNVAEDFCVSHNLHQLLQQIGQLDDPVPPPVSPLSPRSPEVVHFDAADAPSSPPACPSSASPLHVILWPHLRHPTCLEDLDQELIECDDFTSDQLQKITRRKIFQNESQREEFLKACRAGNVIPVLNELVRRLSATQSMDQSPIMMILGKMLCKLNRKDIRKVLISYLHSGAIGPSMDRKIYIRDLNYRTQSNIGKELSKSQPNDLHDWQGLASDIGCSESIELFAKKDLPGMAVLQTWRTRNEATVGKLYEWAAKGQRWDIVRIMEKDMSNDMGA